MTVEKPKPKQLLQPITTGAGSAMNQSQFLEITCNSLEVRERSRVHGVIGCGFVSHWLKNWHESFKPITKHSNRNHRITLDSHLKTALKTNLMSIVRVGLMNNEEIIRSYAHTIMNRCVFTLMFKQAFTCRQLCISDRNLKHYLLIVYYCTFLSQDY